MLKMEKEIKVNKWLTYSNEYIRSNSYDECINLYDKKETEGFLQFVACFDMQQQCCEDSDIYFVDENGKHIQLGDEFYVTKIITSYDIEDVPKAVLEACYVDEDEHNEDEHNEIVGIKLKNKMYYIVIYNYHNGFYSHDLEMILNKDGKPEFIFDDSL